MSGGDGNGYNGGFQGGGSINGQSGPGGPNSGNNTPYSDHSGWSSENNGWGAGGSVGGAQGWNGNSGNNSGGNSSSKAGGMMFGLPGLAPVVTGGLGITVTNETALSAGTRAALTAFAGEVTSALRLGFFGLVGFSLLPAKIAKDDPNMMSKVVTSLPASAVTSTPINSLPLEQATVQVTKRVVDVVKDERQHMAVVQSPTPMSVPVVHAKPTKTPHVFSVSAPGLPNITLTTTKGVPGVKPNTAPQKGFKEEKTNLTRPAGYNIGGNSRDLIIRFPEKEKQDPLYLTITDPLTPAELKKRQDDENRRQQAWNQSHQVEIAQQNYNNAVNDLNNTDKKIRDMQAKLPDVVAATAKAKKVSEQKLSGFPGYKDVLKKIKKQYQDALKYEADYRAEIATTIESRKAKEKNVKDKKDKLEAEKKKPRKGTGQEGHSYHPAPKDNDIKNLGELEKDRDKTPKQGGSGKRKRWRTKDKKFIYEWDSQHGELEKYDRNGNHLGSFDHKTGKQLKGPVPGRNIKKYL